MVLFKKKNVIYLNVKQQKENLFSLNSFNFVTLKTNIMIYITSLLSILLTFLSCSPQFSDTKPSVQIKTEQPQKDKTLKVGAENISELRYILTNKTFAFAGNQTSTIHGVHLVDSLVALGLKPKRVFSPEHGFRGKKDAGEKVNSGTDPKTGIPIISLYGKHKKPTTEDLKGLDYVVFDIQDVGVRFYTYISTLHYIMEACAENGIKLLVLDRPNPNGNLIDGPILESDYTSFVGMHPIPIAHGMTIGEYAKMINGEKWLDNQIQCNLQVIPCENYTRNMPYILPVKPSPNLPNAQSIALYPSLCLFEGTTVSVGRGTPMPFQIFGSPELKGTFEFTPKPGPGSKYPKHENKLCHGEDLRTYQVGNTLHLSWLISAYKASSKPFFTSFFTKLSGTKKLQQHIEDGWSEERIKASWEKGLNTFKTMRQPYLIYN